MASSARRRLALRFSLSLVPAAARRPGSPPVRWPSSARWPLVAPAPGWWRSPPRPVRPACCPPPRLAPAFAVLAPAPGRPPLSPLASACPWWFFPAVFPPCRPGAFGVRPAGAFGRPVSGWWPLSGGRRWSLLRRFRGAFFCASLLRELFFVGRYRACFVAWRYRALSSSSCAFPPSRPPAVLSRNERLSIPPACFPSTNGPAHPGPLVFGPQS